MFFDRDSIVFIGEIIRIGLISIVATYFLVWISNKFPNKDNDEILKAVEDFDETKERLRVAKEKV